MKTKTVLLLLFIVSLAFLVRSPALAEERALDPTRVTPIAIDAKEGYVADSANYLGEGEYFDPTLHVVVERDRYLETDMWVVRVRIAHPSQLRSAFASRYGSQGGAAAAMIARHVNAVVAINADYHSFDDNGVVLRQGQLYRSRLYSKPSNDLLIIDDQGDFHVVMEANKDAFTEAYEALGGSWNDGGSVVNIFSFGPVLVRNGTHAYETYYGYNMSVDRPVQRMAIAQTGPLSYLLVTCEGPESFSDSVGLTIPQMADYLVALGCETAYNLDGGNSSSLIFQGEKINSPGSKKVRPVMDIVYFSTGIAAGR